jgi:ATP phosphoribosyltransferase
MSTQSFFKLFLFSNNKRKMLFRSLGRTWINVHILRGASIHGMITIGVVDIGIVGMVRVTGSGRHVVEEVDFKEGAWD